MGKSLSEESASDRENSPGEVPESNSKNSFSEGEKVLAFHGPRIYEAKIQRAEFRKNVYRYFVHYLGWNKNWDEWVGMDRLMKHTKENVLKKQALNKKFGIDKNTKPGRSSQVKSKSPADAKVAKEEMKNSDATVPKEEMKNNVAKGKKRKDDSGIEGNPVEDKMINIQIPSTLRQRLVDDWEFIIQQNKLVKLPRSPTIDGILTKYLEYRTEKDGMMNDAVAEILKGLRYYFDKALSCILLYKTERQQYNEAISDRVSPSSIYGAEHLLRLFVKLPELLEYVNIEEETLIRLQQNLLDFLKFLQDNEGTFFLAAYDDHIVTEESG
ncbi:protein MRG1-like isoform X2 [Olea europaea var. sylvestris]|uniref:protein MRG1-like isoform X2 n=1 Tax=Olea europaea var. sylvestris TaxID=158386 RepID=UPI000C1D4796|nr:protein MRG1-like isoform X2 [Olea europaea var. sylvestris]